MFKIIALLLLSLELSAQSFHAAPNLSTGNTGIAHQGIFSLTSNGSGIADIGGITIGTAHQKHFIPSDLKTTAFYLAMPTRQNGTLATHYYQYSKSRLSTEQAFGLTYAKKVLDNLHIGVTTTHHRYQISDHFKQNTISLDIGAQYIIKKWVFGCVMKNAFHATYGRDTELTREIGIGTSHRFSDQILLSIDAVHDYERIDIRSGIAYKFYEKYIFRGGVSSQPTQYYAGFGWKWKKLSVDISSSFHPKLGTSPQLAIGYALK